MLPPKGLVPKRVHVNPIQKFKLKTTFWAQAIETDVYNQPKIDYDELMAKFCEKAELVQVAKPAAAPKQTFIYILEQKKVNNTSIVMSKFPFKPIVIIQYIKELSDLLDLEIIEKLLTTAPNDEETG
jgi:hypothetical protein